MTDSPNLGLPYLEAAQAQKHVTHNEALRRLDALVQAVVADRTLTVPPSTPAEGESFIPAAGASGAWSGHALEIASWQDGAWAFYAPQEGWRIWSSAENALLAFDGTAWIVAGGAALLNPAALVGVNATADTTNRLSVSAPATLLNHAGAGHQLKLNKSAAADTAALLYQTGFSGRAEMGTTGGDDFHVKVSADGTTWHEAIVVDKSTGAVSFPNTSIGSGGVTDGDKGDITVSGSGATWTIDADTITNAKLANVATATFKGRTTAGTGDPEDLTIAQAKTLLNLTGTNSGDQTITLTGDVTGTGAASFATTIATDAVTYAKMQNASAGNVVLARAAATSGDYGEVAIGSSQLFGRGATGDLAAITLGTNLSMSGTTLNASGGGGGGLSDADYGDITVTGTGTVMTIDPNAVSNTKLADMATQTFKGRTSAGSGDPEDLTIAQAKTMLNLTGTNSGDQTITLTGDVTGSGGGSFAATIANDAVTNPKLANMATATFKGRATAGSGDPEDLTATQATALLDAFTSGAKGLAPASGGGTTNFLRADGTWAAPSGGGGGSPGGSDTQMQYNDGGAFGGAAHVTYDDATGALNLAKWANLAEQASDPALPAAGINLFAKKIGGRRMARFNTPLDSGSFLQPLLATQKVGLLIPIGNSNLAPTAVGVAAPTATGTLTARNVTTTNILTRTRRLGIVSAATAASTASIRQAAAQWTLGNGSGLGGFFFSMTFNVSDPAILAAGRMFFGLSSQTTAIVDSEPSGYLNSFGVGAGSADTNLKIFYGGSTAQTPIDLGANFPSDTTNTDLYRVILFSSPSETGIVYYEVQRLNTGDVATGTLGPGTAGVTLPATTTLLTYHGFRSNAGNAVAVAFDYSQVYIETEQ